MKAINKNFTNGEIYSIAINFMNNFSENEVRMPAAIAYSIQKNKATIGALAEEIEKSRVNVVEHYASSRDADNYTIPQENIEDANRELSDLLSIEQDVKIYTVKIEDLGDIQLTTAQMNAIMFMIDEDGE